MDPTPPKQASLASHTGAARFAYNWGLALVTTRLEQRAAGGDVEVPWTLPELRREWNRAKQQIAPWWRMNSKEAYSSGLDALARKHVQLPRIGVVKTHESTRKLARRLEQGTARILAASISRTANRWFVSFTVEVQRQVPASNARTSVVGVDVGVRYLAVLSTGQIIPNPRPLEGSLHRLRRLARAISDTGTAQLRRQLAYKATWYGCRLVVADRFFPSSKTCSACGWGESQAHPRRAHLCCEACLVRIDRDLNAARNLAKLVEAVAQSGWETQTARGADRKPQLAGAGGDEAGSRHRVLPG